MKARSLLRHLTIWTALLVAVPGLLIMAIYTMSQINIIKQKKLEILSQQVAFQESLIDYWIEDRVVVVKKISQLIMFRTLNYDQMKDTLDLIQRNSRDFDSLSYIDKDGLFKMTTLSTGITHPSAIDKPYYVAAKEGKDFVSDVVVGRNSGQPIINFSSPVYDQNGQFQGLILGSVRTTTLQTLMRETWIGQTGEILLLNAAGSMIAEPRNIKALTDKQLLTETDIPATLPPQAMKTIYFGQTGNFSGIDYLGNKVIMANRYLPNRNWTLIGKINEAEILAPFYSQLTIMIGCTILLVLLFIPLAIMITSKIKRPIEWLNRQSMLVVSKKYAEVGQEAYPPNIPQELGTLCRTFIQMSRTIEKEMTERQKAQEELQDLNSRLEEKVLSRTEELQYREYEFRTLVENNPAIICRLDRNYQFVYVNPTHSLVTGKPAAQVIGRTLAEIGVPETVYSLWIDCMETVFQEGRAVECESVGGLLNHDRIYSIRFIPEYDWAGEVSTVLSVSHDVTERKLSESVLKENEKRLRNILDQCPAGIVVVDHKGIIEAINECLIQAIVGTTWQDSMGHSYFDIINKVGYSQEESPIHWALQGRSTCNQIMYRGGCNWVFNVKPIYNNNEITGAIGIYQDISDAIKAEREKAEALQRFEIMFSHNLAAVGMYRISDWKIIDVNPAWEQVYGYDRAEALGKSLEQLTLQPPKIDENIHSVDTEIRTKNGMIRNIIFSALKINFDGEPCLLATAFDITDKCRLEKEMAHFDRLNLVGEMAASIGHEVRNPMTTVRGYLQVLQNNEHFTKYYSQFNLMIEELDRANSIITEFLSLAKNKAVEMKQGSLNVTINALLPLLQADALRMGHDVCLEPGDIAETVFSEKEIRQLILNLVRNSLEAMEYNGVVTIRTYMDKKKISLQVQDSGSGIPEEVLGKLGTPFTSTKAGGTGLGLAVCYRVAERHNAKIAVNTGAEGTTFTILFNSLDN